MSYEIRSTRSRGDAAVLAAKGVEEGFTHIVSVGGDGTSSEVVGAILGTGTIFGVIPLGSGNDFPKACGIPLHFGRALKCIVEGRTEYVDVGSFGGRCFINGLGIGLDGAVAKRFSSLKMFGGFLGYLFGAVIEAFKFEGFDASCEFNGKSLSGRYLLCGACNGPFQGGKFQLAPGASVNDGLLDLYFIDDMKPLRRLVKIPKVLEGSHSSMKEVNISRVDKATLHISRNLPAHMDGEPMELEKGTYDIGISKKSLPVILPSN